MIFHPVHAILMSGQKIRGPISVKCYNNGIDAIWRQFILEFTMKDIMNFVEGFGSIFNIVPTIEKPRIKCLGSDFHDDYNKLAGDWQKIGNDIKQAIDKHEKSPARR